jgi:hypothetical protein
MLPGFFHRPARVGNLITLDELHRKHVNRNRASRRYHDMTTFSSAIVPGKGKVLYTVTVTLQLSSIAGEREHDVLETACRRARLMCRQGIADLSVTGEGLRRVSLRVGPWEMAEAYNGDPLGLAVFPVVAYDKATLCLQGEGDVTIRYCVCELANPRVDYRYWYTTWQSHTIAIGRKIQEEDVLVAPLAHLGAGRTRGRVRLCMTVLPVRRIVVRDAGAGVDLSDLCLVVDGREYEGRFTRSEDGRQWECSFAPLTILLMDGCFLHMTYPSSTVSSTVTVAAEYHQMAVVDTGSMGPGYGH